MAAAKTISIPVPKLRSNDLGQLVDVEALIPDPPTDLPRKYIRSLKNVIDWRSACREDHRQIRIDEELLNSYLDT